MMEEYMAESKIITELAEEKISVGSGLMRLLVIVDSLNNKEFQSWILNELNGYKDSSQLPEYRKNLTTLIKYTGI